MRKHTDVLALVAGLACMAAGELLFPLARRAAVARMSDGTLALMRPDAGVWVLVLGYGAGFALVVTAGVIATRKWRRPGRSQDAED